MADVNELGLEGLAPPGAGPRSRAGAVVAAVLALACSAGFAWWIASSDHRAAPVVPSPPSAAQPAPTVQAAPPPLRYAPDTPDPAEVKRAYGDVRAAFTNGGSEALVGASTACARAVPADPTRLDYCLALDTYASEITADGTPDDPSAADWFTAAPQRDLALARSALPEGMDANDRLDQVAALSKSVLPKPHVARPKAKPKPAHKVRHHVKAKAKPVRRPPPERPAFHAVSSAPKPFYPSQTAAPPPEAPPFDPLDLEPPH